MVAQSGAGLRSRKIDAKRPIPVYRYHEVPDLDQSASLNRAILQVATGVEKEEEEEHHLQAALIASHQTGHLHEQVIIPTPDASRVISDYAKFYSSTFHQPPSSIRFSTPIEDVIGCPYNLDDADAAFLDEIRPKLASSGVEISDDQFEIIIWAFERAGDDKVSGDPPTLNECQVFLEKNEPKLIPFLSAAPDIYEHWKRRRYSERNGIPILPKLKHSEDWLVKADNDPYVCFRRREVKAVRKTRTVRADSQSLDKLRRLRDEMNRARQILELITNREAARKESIVLEHLIFEQRVLVRRLKKKLGIVTSEKESDLSPEVRRRKVKRGDESRDEVVKKIKIPAGTLRNPAQMVALEHRLHESAAECDALTAEGRARKKKMLEESQGWLDLTEVHFNMFSMLDNSVTHRHAPIRLRTLLPLDLGQLNAGELISMLCGCIGMISPMMKAIQSLGSPSVGDGSGEVAAFILIDMSIKASGPELSAERGDLPICDIVPDGRKPILRRNRIPQYNVGGSTTVTKKWMRIMWCKWRIRQGNLFV
ncbi:Enhancer of polycomb-like protein 1 [Thoreauomyces humboldtii]|nr:Enhancer of polycomb-like protein 1 [Thoreauomyces humboldtii]